MISHYTYGVECSMRFDSKSGKKIYFEWTFHSTYLSSFHFTFSVLLASNVKNHLSFRISSICRWCCCCCWLWRHVCVHWVEIDSKNKNAIWSKNEGEQQRSALVSFFLDSDYWLTSLLNAKKNSRPLSNFERNEFWRLRHIQCYLHTFHLQVSLAWFVMMIWIWIYNLFCRVVTATISPTSAYIQFCFASITAKNNKKFEFPKFSLWSFTFGYRMVSQQHQFSIKH